MNRRFAPRALYVLLILSFALVAVPPAAAAPVIAPDAPLATTLVAGDIAIIGINTDDPDQFAFVLLTNVTSGTAINFTDNGWLSAGGFRTGEGTMTWTASADLCAGTVIIPTVSGMSLSTSGDQILAYQGTSASPTFIYALNDAGAGVWQSDATSSNTSALPTGLTNGTTAVALTEIDNAIYTGATTSGTRAALLAVISNKANWSGSDTVRQTMPTGPFTVTDAPPCGGDAAPSVLSTNPSNGATVASNATVSVTFSEPVTFSGPISIVCTNSGTQAVTPTGSGAAWSLPHTDFASGDSCSITIPAAQVSDLDGIAPANMAADFTWSFAVDAAPSVISTTPANLATNVPVGDNLGVTFSEPVNVAGFDSFFDIYCDAVLQPAAGSGGPTTFTINPAADLPAGATCTVTIHAADVTDQDANDPPNTMAADKVFTFTTAVADAAPTVASTIPGDGATGVAVDANLSVTFSEPVDVSNIDSFFDIFCDAVPQPATGSGGPTTFTIDPTNDLPAGSSCTVTIKAAQVTDQDANDPPNNMAADYSWDFTVAEPITLIINELDSDTPGTDALEFVELYDGGAGNMPLDGYVVVFYNGSNDLSYAAYDLDGKSTNTSGYFLLGNSAVVPTPGIIFGGNFLQNGQDAVALYQANATAFPNNTPVTTANLVDAIVYDTSDPDDPGLLVLLNAGQPQVNEASTNSETDSNQRCPNGSGGQRNTSTYLQAAPTAGARNLCLAYDPPKVFSTFPAGSATGVGPGTTITINFNEIVDVAAGAFTVECPSGAAVAFTSSPALPVSDTSSVTLIPSSPLPLNTTCTVTAVATQITDNDSTVHQLDGNGDYTGGDNYLFTFTTAAVDPCTGAATLISHIQGSGLTSPYLNSDFTIQGIVVGDYETGGIRGYFVQEEDSDSDLDAATSEGIFIYDNNATNEVALGDKVRVTGLVSEYTGTGYTLALTEITSSALTICGSGQGGLVTATPVSLPVTALTDLEPYEGMKVTFPQVLTVTDNYDLGYSGQLTLSANGKLWQFTHLNPPSVAGYAAHLAEIALRSIVLDDGNTKLDPDPIIYPGAGLTALNTVRVDDTITGLTGVLDQRYDFNRIQPVGQVDFTAANPRPTTPPAVGGTLKVGAFNTLNFFVTTGSAAICGPSGGIGCRGASNAAEFTRQRDKLVEAICGLDADVLGLMELENPYSGNDPFPSDGITDYVLQNLVGALDSVCPGYAFIDNTGAGTDAIRQGLIYKPNVVTPVGTTAILNSDAFINGGDATARNRPALTQAFQVNAGGEQFIVSVNHLKSKGSACTAPDLLDGQANCAVVRTNAAIALTAWLATNPTTTGDPDILIMGDLNSYAKEDPITAFVNAGYTDLINWTVGTSGYGYAFDGMMGYLDHALGSSALLAQVTAADEWHINSPEPDVLDYNTEYKSAGQIISLYNADPYRSTDHDAVLVGLGLGLNPDLGDLAASYGAAWHTGQGVVWKLGSLWTGEASSTPGSDDPSDDGVVRNYSESWNDTRGEVNVTVTGAAGHWACLNAWLDYSDGSAVAGVVETPNGLFDANERVVNNLPIQAGADQLVTWPLESGVINNAATYNMRFRLVPAPDPAVASCSGVTLAPDGGGSATGVAYGGEVEDYAFIAGPLAVNLASFTATVAAEGVTLAWETVSETGNAGFNVYRADSSLVGQDDGSSGVDPLRMTGWVRLNEALIAAAAPGASEGHSYAFTDATAAQGATYWYALEDVALNGTATRHAPVSVTVAEPNAVGLAAFAAAPLAGSMPALAGLAALAMAALAGVGLRRRKR